MVFRCMLIVVASHKQKYEIGILRHCVLVYSNTAECAFQVMQLQGRMTGIHLQQLQCFFVLPQYLRVTPEEFPGATNIAVSENQSNGHLRSA